MIPSRIEKDSMGSVNVPSNRLWGAQTQRALEHFHISIEKMPNSFISSLALIKRSAAIVNYKLGLLKKHISEAIIQAADEVMDGKHNEEFPLVVWQTGSGTQTNMNMNEVLANRASEILGGKRGVSRLVHPNDDVNKSQSSNDVFPSAIHIASAITIIEQMLPKIIKLKNILYSKSESFKNIVKIGRTHLQDAIPLTLGQEISGWVAMLENNIKYIEKSIPNLFELALGGTAVGTGLNTHQDYAISIAKIIADFTQHPFVTAPNKFESLSSTNAVVNSHGTLKSLAVSLMKIANDIRWLSSGPRCGIGEITIPANEPGSSIMPGKVNPTQCEAITMICCQVMGNDVSISIGGSLGNFELNVFRPMILYNFLQSIRLITDGIDSFNRYCINGIEPAYARIDKLLNESLMLVTVLNNYIGYDKAAKIAEKAYKENLTLKTAAMQLGYLTEVEFDNLVKPDKMVGDI
ncbi:class II fumarate hydratase [Candidatus Pantoea edessiphila]|uniref:Fumarate hydratase class II n=1 Tax=Candidatus Pantoea edessiphila TaxID=2044610 RepID=A0A2P5SWU8_9GAMM|nr:class II fumarate hydratase [Candidatus Pantoea edessiphila]PPI86793.1 fumarate hydratase, class II [Candidatus Pantoea edessiphila]